MDFCQKYFTNIVDSAQIQRLFFLAKQATQCIIHCTAVGRITRQVYNLFQDLWNRYLNFEGWGVGAKSLGVKAGWADRQTDRHNTRHIGLTGPLGLLEIHLVSIL